MSARLFPGYAVIMTRDSKKIILGTRGSSLALAQSKLVASGLLAWHPSLNVEIKVIKTTGDQRLDVSLSQPGALDKGLFTKELEESLLKGEIDAAVHSLKDLPTELPGGLCISAILERANPFDLLVSKHSGGLMGLPPQAIVATSSLRRKTQLLGLRSDLKIEEIRGNVPTRLKRLADSPDLDALLIAKAGIDRLGEDIIPPGLHTVLLEEILPAPGQGAIALESRSGDAETTRILSELHHEATAMCVTAERDLLVSIGGGCHTPIGTLASIHDGKIRLRAILFDSNSHSRTLDLSWEVAGKVNSAELASFLQEPCN